ncbi:MAG: coniferyl-alcohol dehydrogenase [Desulfobacterales bacterium]|nr:coniferyl-alcohol dehydrogenase [Desulfobacterales bacterium]
MDLKNKKIIVTGVASGIGAETAKVIKAHGASVIGVDINEATENVDEFIQADLSDPDSIEKAVAKIDGKIDGLCNVAGLPPTKAAVAVLNVNFLGLRHLTELVVKKMNDNGSIVNIASLAGLEWPESGDQIRAFLKIRDFGATEAFCRENDIVGGRSYFFSKEVLIVWTMMNRWTWRDRGIRINCVSPGPVETPILADFLETMGERGEEDMRIMDRPGTPEDIAPVAAFMLSDDSLWIRGANIPCDGGMFSHIQCEMHGHTD